MNTDKNRSAKSKSESKKLLELSRKNYEAIEKWHHAPEPPVGSKEWIDWHIKKDRYYELLPNVLSNIAMLEYILGDRPSLPYNLEAPVNNPC